MADLDNKLKIFMYMDYREYLGLLCQARPGARQLRRFHRVAGIQSPNYLKS